MQFRVPKGTTDIVPDVAVKWQYLERIAVELFKKYGYKPIITPIFEHTEVFTRSIGSSTDIVQKEMYTFEDKGNRSLTLRPEGTAPVIRAYVEQNMNQLPQPVKLYYTGPMFRYERPQAGRYRQFWQIGVEAIGSDDPAVDAESILLLINYFKAVGLKELALYINSMGCENDRPQYIEMLKDYAEAKRESLCNDCVKRIDLNPLRLFDCKNETCQTVMADAPKLIDHLCESCRGHFDEVKHYLEMQCVNYVIKPELVRGLDYYTKTTFEVVSPLLGAQNAIGGGGRYNKLVEEFGGPSTPGIGFALGTERLALAVEKEGVFDVDENSTEVFIAVADPAAKHAAVNILYELRAKDVSADIDYMGRSLKAQLKAANRRGIRYFVFLGSRELESGAVVVKDMENGAQEEVKLNELVEYLTGLVADISERVAD
ncbi:MAG: histidine--tRNA ligase [Actinomycetota bacterium]|nr:histidine--tRNA ligase [Actinomycetota bacterium]